MSEYADHIQEMIRLGGMHECASDCPLPPPRVLAERIYRAGPRWLQDTVCFVFGHDWSHGPHCVTCGRLEHYR